MTHAVDHYSLLLGGGGDDFPTGAHAEGIYPSLPTGVREMIFGRAEVGVPRHVAVEHTVHILAPVLNSHTHRDGLCLHGKTATDERVIGIACTMAGGKHDDPCLHRPTRGGHRKATVGQAGIAVKPTTVIELTACLLNSRQHIFHHHAQNIRANVGLCLKGNILGRAKGRQGLQHEGATRVVNASE